MTLTEDFKREAVFTIEGYVSKLKRTKPEDLFGIKRVTKYKNYQDFWHGYFLGNIEGQLMQTFFKDYKREMTPRERIELDQIIALYEIHLREAIEKLK